MTFQEARARLTEISGGRYRSMYYQLTETGSGKHEAACRVYIENTTHVMREYPTWQEAIDAHIKAQVPPAVTVADVAEMPTESELTSVVIDTTPVVVPVSEEF